MYRVLFLLFMGLTAGGALVATGFVSDGGAGAGARAAMPLHTPRFPAVSCDFTVLNFNMSGTGAVGATRPISITAGDTFEQFIAPPITATSTSEASVIVNNNYTGNLTGGIIGTFTLTNLNGILVTNPEGLGAAPRGFQLNDIVLQGANGTITAVVAINFIALSTTPPYFPRAFNGYLHSIATSGSYSHYRYNGTLAGTIFSIGGNLTINAAALGRLYAGGGALNEFVTAARAVPPNRVAAFLQTDTIAQFHLPDFEVGLSAAQGHITPRSIFAGTAIGTIDGGFVMDHNALVVDSGPNAGKGWFGGEFTFSNTDAEILTGPWLADLNGNSMIGYVWQVLGTGVYTDSLLFGTVNGSFLVGGANFTGTMTGVYCEGSQIPTATPSATSISTDTPSVTATIPASTPSPTATYTFTFTSTPIPTNTAPPSTPTTTLTHTYTPTPTPSSRPGTPTGTPTPCVSFWRSVPHLDTPDRAYLLATASLSSDDVWAVGYYYRDVIQTQPLIQHWNGANWQTMPVPPFLNATIQAVFSITADDVWAVGNYNDGLTTQPLALHWNGSEWRQVATPSIGEWTSLVGVTANSSTDVWAVGAYSIQVGTKYEDRTLVVHWNGTQWTQVPSPNNAVAHNVLVSVSAVAPDDVWAVGFSAVVGPNRSTLIEHWNGNQWTIVSSPNPGNDNNLSGVVAIDAGNVWAAGYNENGAFALRWGGSVWRVAPISTANSANAVVRGITARTPNDVWIVGYKVTSRGTRTFVAHWDGARWSEGLSPNPHGLANGLRGVVLNRDNDAWTVGKYGLEGEGTSGTLITTYAMQGCCNITFSDVQPTDYFYEAVRYLYCAGAISGYSDNTFRPYNNTTRAQLCKIIVLAEGWPIDASGGPHFTDVQPTDTFYGYIETAFNQEIIAGYADGTFRGGNNVTRGQLCKIIVLAEDWGINTSGGPHFTDVPITHPFYDYVETSFSRGIIAGYADGTFQPGNSATRGQICKIVYSALAP